MVADRNRRDVDGARQGIVHERAGDRLAARVIVDLFHQRLADTLRDAAMQLAGDDHRIDNGAEIIDAAVAHDLDHAGLRIDLDFGDVTAVGESRGDFLGGVIDVE